MVAEPGPLVAKLPNCNGSRVSIPNVRAAERARLRQHGPSVWLLIVALPPRWLGWHNSAHLNTKPIVCEGGDGNMCTLGATHTSSERHAIDIQAKMQSRSKMRFRCKRLSNRDCLTGNLQKETQDENRKKHSGFQFVG